MKKVFFVIIPMMVIIISIVYLVITKQTSLLFEVPFLEKPAELVGRKMIEKSFLLQTSSYGVEGDLLIQAPALFLSFQPLLPSQPQDTQQTTGRVKFAVSGQVDQRDKNKPKSKEITEISYMTEGMTLNFSSESRTIGEKFYFYLKTIPNIPFLDTFLQPLKRQWILVEQRGPTFGTDLKMNFQTEKTLKLIKRLKEIISEKPLFQIKEKLKKEIIDGVLCYRYRITLDKEVIKKIYLDSFEILTEKQPSEEDLEKIDQILENLEQLHQEVWIGKKDYYLRKWFVKGNFELGEKKEIKINFEVNCVFSDFDKDLKIEEPAEAKKIEEIMTNESFELLFLPLISKDMSEEIQRRKRNARNAKRITDLTIISSALEMYYSDEGDYPLRLKELEKSPKGISYLSPIPSDPLGEFPYFYFSTEDKQYLLLAIREPEKEVSMPEMKGEERLLIISPSGLEFKNPRIVDTDNDKIIDWLENILGTDPNNSDSDSDGYLDGQELANGYNFLGAGPLKPLTIEIKNKILAEQ